MDHCILCKCKELRQPAVPGKPGMFPIVPLNDGGVPQPHNYVPLCRYHEMMYHRWFNEAERELCDKVIKKYMKSKFPGWKKDNCKKFEEELNNSLIKRIRRKLT